MGNEVELKSTRTELEVVVSVPDNVAATVALPALGVVCWIWRSKVVPAGNVPPLPMALESNVPKLRLPGSTEVEPSPLKVKLAPPTVKVGDAEKAPPLKRPRVE